MNVIYVLSVVLRSGGERSNERNICISVVYVRGVGERAS